MSSAALSTIAIAGRRLVVAGTALLGVSQGMAAERIGIASSGERYFVVASSGRRYVPLGVNYIVQHRGAPYQTFDMFDPATFNEAEIDSNLAAIAGAGFNVVRLWLKGLEPDKGFGLGPHQISPAYVDEVVETVRMAKRHGLHVVLTGGFKQGTWLPRNYLPTSALPDEATVGGMNRLLLLPELARATALFYRDLLAAMQKRDADITDSVFYFDLYNEIGYDLNQPPFAAQQGQFSFEGKNYDLASPAERQALMDEAARSWFATVKQGVASAAPHMLVTASSFLNAAFGHKGFDGGRPTVKPPAVSHYALRPRAILAGGADLFDIHIYPSNNEGPDGGFHDRLQRNLRLSEIDPRAPDAPPLIAGEFGAQRGSFPSLEAALPEMAASAEALSQVGFSGYMVWMWNGGGDTWTLKEEGLARVLEPKLSPSLSEKFDPDGR